MHFTLIIPVYNEASVIEATLRDLSVSLGKLGSSRGITWEIIVVDNASTDRTPEVLRGFAHPHVRIVTLPEKGKGRAVRAGFLASKGDIVGFTDADLSIPPEEISAAFASILEGDADVVIGSRAHQKSVLPEREWWRTASSRLFNAMVRLLIGIPFRDTQCPLKVMTAEAKEIFLQTKDTGWFFDVEFLALARARELHILEVPVRWQEHHYPKRKSKLSTTRDGFRSILALWSIRQRLAQQLAKSPERAHNTTTMKWVIVGLGNPGGEYTKTRHNAGRIVLEEFAALHGFSDWEYRKTADARVAKGMIAGKDVLLVAPETFMNASGKSVAAYVKNPTDQERLVVIHDDVDLPLGSWRFAHARGSGGQKGVESIMTALHSKDFIRLRIGVGKDSAVHEKAGDFVLQKFLPEELLIVSRIGRSPELFDALSMLCADGLEASRSKWKKWTEERTSSAHHNSELIGPSGDT